MQLRLVKLIDIFEHAGMCERLMSKPKAPGTPAMWDLLDMAYDVKDVGYYEKKPLKLRANPKQMTCWELAIDLLLLIDLEQRRLIWGRAMRFSWVALAKKFGVHRTTIKKRYMAALIHMEQQAKLNKLLDKIDKIN